MPIKIFKFCFILLWFLPVIMTFFQLDSYTVSTVAVVFIFNLIYYLYVKEILFTRFFYSISAFLIAFISLHTVITGGLFDDGYNLGRGLISIGMLFIFLLGAYNFSRVLLFTIPDNFLKNFFNYIFYFYVFIIILSFITRVVPSKYTKPIFPYPEPSHLALFFGPIIGYLILSAKKSTKRFQLILIGIVISLLIKNMTLLVTMIILSVFVYNIYVVPILIIGGLGMYFFSDLEYFLERLDFNNMEQTNNLSTLVYVKGFQLMEESLKLTNGLGIGFQQLGYVPIRTEIGDYLKLAMGGVELNSQDGGFTAAKLISEFGIVGIILISFYIVYLVKQWKRFRKLSFSEISSNEALFFASLITIFSEFFFRGLGYFSASMFLFFTVLFLRNNVVCKNE